MVREPLLRCGGWLGACNGGDGRLDMHMWCGKLQAERGFAKPDFLR